MIDTALGKPLPNSAGLYSTDCPTPPTGPSGGGRAIGGEE